MGSPNRGWVIATFALIIQTYHMKDKVGHIVSSISNYIRLSIHFEYANKQITYHFWLCGPLHFNQFFILPLIHFTTVHGTFLYRVTVSTVRGRIRSQLYIILQLYHENSRFPPSFKFWSVSTIQKHWEEVKKCILHGFQDLKALFLQSPLLNLY
jgi:hypothetical protein